MNQFIIFDTEYASWEGFLLLSKEEQKKAEIVQISALKVNLEDLSVVGKLNIYIKPYFTPKLTQYFINLTGITDKVLDQQGIGFIEAYQKFRDFVGNLPCYSHGWSLSTDDIADGTVMQNNLDMFNFSDPFAPDYRNIANWFRQEYKNKNIAITKQSSGQIAKLLNCEKEIAHLGLDEHNAIYDVYSILAGLRFLQFRELF